jgi:hypothetical protein
MLLKMLSPNIVILAGMTLSKFIKYFYNYSNKHNLGTWLKRIARDKHSSFLGPYIALVKETLVL